MWSRENAVVMQVTGVILMLIGAVLIVWAANMNVTVTSKAQKVGGIKIPSQTVNNIGLMDDRRNLLLVGGLTEVIGVVLIGVGTIVKKPAGMVACPYCAEDIRHDAVVCRYCGHDIAGLVAQAEASPEEAYPLNGNCSACHSPLEQGAKFCGECGATLGSPPALPVGEGETCPDCGAPAIAGDRFCRACGYTLAV